MVGGIHLYGGFRLSPYLATRVFEAVHEITEQSVNHELSHVDDSCELCRSAGMKEAANDAAGADRPGHQWEA